MVARNTKFSETAMEEGRTGYNKSRTSHGEGNLGWYFYFKRIEVFHQKQIKQIKEKWKQRIPFGANRDKVKNKNHIEEQHNLQTTMAMICAVLELQVGRGIAWKLIKEKPPGWLSQLSICLQLRS